jgi:hypothetical protein
MKKLASFMFRFERGLKPLPNEFSQNIIISIFNILGQDYTQYSHYILCPNWITANWESLHACKATVAINSDWLPQSARIGDITIMEELTVSDLVKKRDLTDMNRCGVYL